MHKLEDQTTPGLILVEASELRASPMLEEVKGVILLD